jgi:hypothetical protein
MAFWTSVSKTDNDPKRNFRWKIDVGYMTANETTANGVVWWAKKVTKPNFQVQESKHNFLNHTFYWPGRTEWQIVSMTLVDPVSPNAAAQTSRIIADSGYKVPGNSAALETMSKGKAGAALTHVIISQIDHEGKTIEEWRLENPFIKSVKFGELDYENDELTQIELEFRYDWAVCSTDGEIFYDKVTS